MTSSTGITGLGHVGLWVDDLDVMRDFFVEVLGLTVTDEDAELGMVFLSSCPETEHHEMVLQAGRRAATDTRLVHQISWRVESIEQLQAFDRCFAERGIRVQQRVTHGNALGIYFFDPEGNRLEVYFATGEEVPQPFRKTISMDLPPERLLAESRRLVDTGGERYQPAP
ncbi:MAG TPA: VOC family protein [Acidimicrobiales bacterium]|nr:VOC family protein [Acidimicrobiales bacterium]